MDSPRSSVLARLGRVHRVWWLNGAILVAGVPLAGAVAGFPAIAAPYLPWWLLAVAVAVCERYPIDLEFQRSRHSFSLTDVPITLGLIFAPGHEAMAGILLGSAVALLARRLPAIKIVFNLGQFVVAIGLASLCVHAVAGAHAAFGPRTWIGALLGLQLGGVATVLLLAAVISLADGRMTLKELRQMFGMDFFVTAASTSIALVGAMVLISDPTGLPILLVPVVIGVVGYRAYIREHERHKKVEFLYQANRGLTESPEVAVAVEGLLERAREAFRAEHAEVIFLGHNGHPPLRTRLGSGHDRESLEPVDPAAAEALRALAQDGPIAFRRPLPDAVAVLAGEREVSNAMAAVLRGKDRSIGVIMLANRVGLTRGFGEDDLALFETLAANASAALQFDRLEQAVSELRDLQHRLHHQAYHDPLTGLANRSLFAQEVGNALQRSEGVAVLFIDLDDFKGINDTLGHGVGDQLLCAVSSRIGRSVGPDDLVARLGGDEFAVLVRADADTLEPTAVRVAQSIVGAFEQPVTVAERLLSVHLSLGIATDRHSGSSTADLLRDADVAMYEAKSTGKGRYALFTRDMRDAVIRRHTLRDELADAIARGELKVQYQPIVDLAGGAVAAVEALVRWEHPVHGRIPPLEFIPLAEETSLIVPLGRHVLREACTQAVAWTAAGGAPISIQVNLSTRELEDPDLIANVAATLAATGLPAARLTLEITETLLVRDAVAGGATLDGLQALGVRLALDDFGTGYSSLSYMRSLPLDSLKIAKEFIDAMASTENDRDFVRLIVELARVCGLSVVAEGIETAEQLDALRALGCDRGQGYYFARPLDHDDPRLAEAIGLPALAFG